MAEKKKVGRPKTEESTKIKGEFLDVFKVVKKNKEDKSKEKKEKPE